MRTRRPDLRWEAAAARGRRSPARREGGRGCVRAYVCVRVCTCMYVRVRVPVRAHEAIHIRTGKSSYSSVGLVYEMSIYRDFCRLVARNM